jgi:hypothetical protein
MEYYAQTLKRSRFIHTDLERCAIREKSKFHGRMQDKIPFI